MSALPYWSYKNNTELSIKKETVIKIKLTLIIFR